MVHPAAMGHPAVDAWVYSWERWHRRGAGAALLSPAAPLHVLAQPLEALLSLSCSVCLTVQFVTTCGVGVLWNLNEHGAHGHGAPSFLPCSVSANALLSIFCLYILEVATTSAEHSCEKTGEIRRLD